MKKLKLNSTAFAGAEVLSRAELKNVMGGGLPPDTGGGDDGSCGVKGHSVCGTNSGNGSAVEYFYACCTTMAEAQSFCMSHGGGTYQCKFNTVE